MPHWTVAAVKVLLPLAMVWVAVLYEADADPDTPQNLAETEALAANEVRASLLLWNDDTLIEPEQKVSPLS